jgi:hypothetical protein
MKTIQNKLAKLGLEIIEKLDFRITSYIHQMSSTGEKSIVE